MACLKFRKDSTPAPSDAKCLAISVRKRDMTRLLTLNCLESHGALCVKLENDSFDDGLYTKSVTLSDTTVPEGSLDIKPASSSLGIILGVIAAILAIVITATIISRKRRKHLIQQNNHQQGLENSHSAVTYSPAKNPAQAYDYSDIGQIGINQIQLDRNEEIYHHLGEAEKNPQNDDSKNIYGHTGLTENEYDLTSTSRIPERNDTAEDLYDHSSDIVS